MTFLSSSIVWLWLCLCLSLGMMTPGIGQAADILTADKVFSPTVTAVTDDEIELTIDIKPGYYLYRERLFSVTAVDDALTLTAVRLSEGSQKNDAFFGNQSIWYGGKDSARISIAYRKNTDKISADSAPVKLQLKYQGCQEGVICYPPQTVVLPITFPDKTAEITESNDNNPLFKHQANSNDALFAPKKQSPFQQSNLSSSSLNSSAGVGDNAPLFGQSSKNQLLPEEEAFQVSVSRIDATTLQVHWQVANGYYLYRDKTAMTATTMTDEQIRKLPISNIQWSAGQTHSDEFFGEQTIYRHNEAIAQVYLTNRADSFTLNLRFQGCADKGICYPLMYRQVSLIDGLVGSVVRLDTPEAYFPKGKTNAYAGSADNGINNDLNAESTSELNSGLSSELNSTASMIEQLAKTLQSRLWLGLLLLFLAGVALSFTPCVLPMLPILLGIITNQRQVSRARAAVLSSSYALGVAVMMAVFGLVVAKTNINIQIIFQQPLWLMVFAAIFIVMGLAMAGVFNIAMPGRVQNRVIAWQNRLTAATPWHLFLVGALSTLVVGPCVAPPLIAVLAFIATTDDSVRGALYLFAMGLGMSLPLVVFATVLTAIPKTGAFSRLITRVFALLMFGVGLWLLARLLPGALGLVAWGLWMLAVAWVFWRSGLVQHHAQLLTRGIAAVALLVAVAWLLGGIMGNSNPLKPFTRTVKLPFHYVNSVAELERALNDTKQPVMMDLYADWCVSCQEIEHITLADPDVADALADFTLLKLDITDSTADNRRLLAQLDLIGPPSLLFFANGKEISSARHIGVTSKEELLQKIKYINGKKASH